MIWWLGFALALIPFNFGLVYMWRRLGDAGAAIKLGPLDIKGPIGFVVFALGLVGCGYCIWQLAGAPGDRQADQIATGKVRHIAGVAPLVGPLAGDDRVEHIRRWLAQFEKRAPVLVDLRGGERARRGDYLATLRDQAPKQLPKELANLDSDTTALLRVGNPSPPTVTAVLDDFAAQEAAVDVPDPVSPEDAMRQTAPVREGRRVVLIGHDEGAARDELRGQMQKAGDTTDHEARNLYLNNVIEMADRFPYRHPGAFFAAEVLLNKGDAYALLGQSTSAITTYKTFTDLFPLSPKLPGVRERLRKLQQPDLPEAVPSSQGISYGAGRSGSSAEPTFVSASYDGTTTERHDRRIVSAARARAIVPARAIAVRASRTLASKGRVDYDPANTLDGSIRTAWSEGARGDGKGVTITFAFRDAYDVTTMRLVNGYAKSQAIFNANSRLRTVTVTTDRGTKRVRLRNTRQRQSWGIPRGRTRFVRIKIVSVYRGTFDNAMLSEVEFLTGG
jgi:hypothetical protein